jgi:hypothetical protein
MQSEVVLLGVCVAVSRPEPIGKAGTMMATLTLDVAQHNGKFIDTIPVEVYGEKATDSYRDLLPGDLVSIDGTVEEWGPRENRKMRAVAWTVYNWGAAGGARPPTVNRTMVMGEVVRIGNIERYNVKVGKRWVKRNRLEVVVVVDRARHHSSVIKLTIYEPWAGKWRAVLTRGGIVSARGKLQSYRTREGVSGMNWVVTQMEMLPFHRRIGRYAAKDEEKGGDEDVD